MASEKKIPNALKFLFGGSSGMAATCIVHPMDLIKTRMQVAGMSGKSEYKSSLHAIQSTVANEGVLGLYSGIGAALLRQATYTTGRLGVYTYLIDKYKTAMQHDPTIIASMAMATLAGAVGSFVGTPAEVALIRMTADGRLPPDERRNYRNVIDALTRITKEEGVLNLWRGCIPTVARAMIVNMSQLASYSQFKGLLKKTVHMPDGAGLHLVSSLMSGLLTTITSMPLDIVKTRIQNQKITDGKPQYSGLGDVLVKLVKNEGVFALWKGFTPYFLKLGPHTVLTFIFLEQINRLYMKHAMGVEGKDSGI